ncbi:GntR family transcriptional regulator [Marinoscillum sp.]|uniref:GntR family transcriptional regulator n=1 Tax=Marinoscillum sp. TaxID=2024838 RepID=UPI003BABA6F9
MDFKDNQAIYLQIADLFCENILLAKWNAGDRIPSVREMAVNTEVNPNTVMRTYNYLQEKGIIYNKRGIGYFVADDGFEKTKALRKCDFVTQELPELFKAMDLLQLTFEDIHKYYQDFKKRAERSPGLNK